MLHEDITALAFHQINQSVLYKQGSPLHSLAAPVCIQKHLQRERNVHCMQILYGAGYRIGAGIEASSCNLKEKKKGCVVGKEINMHLTTYTYFTLDTMRHYEQHEVQFPTAITSRENTH